VFFLVLLLAPLLALLFFAGRSLHNHKKDKRIRRNGNVHAYFFARWKVVLCSGLMEVGAFK